MEIFFAVEKSPFVVAAKSISNLTGKTVRMQFSKKVEELALVDGDIVFEKPIAVLIHLSQNSSLLMQNQMCLTWQLLEHFLIQVLGPLNELRQQLSGEAVANQAREDYCKIELTKSLKLYDKQLKFRTFLVGDNLSLFDVILVAHLHPVATSRLGAELLNGLGPFRRWYDHVVSKPPIMTALNQAIAK